jgi:hypothetical protein
MISRPVLVCLMVAVVSGPAAAADPPIGRLFFTPAQRASLDIARSQRTRATVATERTEQVVEQPVPQTLTYGGMVRRSDGRTTVWINDRPVDDQEAAGGSTVIRRVGPDGAVTLEVPQSKRRVDLKVGQSVEVLSGSIGETYSRPPPESKPESGNAAPGGGTPPGPAGGDAGPEESPATGAAARGAAPTGAAPGGN